MSETQETKRKKLLNILLKNIYKMIYFITLYICICACVYIYKYIHIMTVFRGRIATVALL